MYLLKVDCKLIKNNFFSSFLAFLRLKILVTEVFLEKLVINITSDINSVWLLCDTLLESSKGVLFKYIYLYNVKAVGFPVRESYIIVFQ